MIFGVIVVVAITEAVVVEPWIERQLHAAERVGPDEYGLRQDGSGCVVVARFIL